MMMLCQPGAQGSAARKCGRPLMPLAGFASMAGIPADQARHFIERGGAAWTWDFSLSQRRAVRRLFRILPECIEHAAAGRECTLDFPAVLGLMFPGAGESVRASDVARVLNVTGDFVYVLVRRRELEALTGRRPGRQGTARISFESVRGLLQRRRYVSPRAKASVCGRSLISVSQATRKLSCKWEKVMALVEDGQIAWCFAVGLAGKAKRIRILPSSLEAWQAGQECRLGVEDALAIMVPEDRPTISAADVCGLLGISQAFLGRLVKAKELSYVSQRSAGAFGSEGVATKSLIGFLRRRRYPEVKEKR